MSTVLAIFLLRSFTKLPKRKSLFQFQREEQTKKLKLYDPPSPQRCWIKIEKWHLKKAARPFMVCFLAATADEYLRASLKCIQIQKYGSSESVNIVTFSTCVCVGGDLNEGQTLNMQKIISLQFTYVLPMFHGPFSRQPWGYGDFKCVIITNRKDVK